MVAPHGLWAPDRGNIISIDFDPQAGHEIQKRRPALVLTPKDFNKKTGFAFLCPITSTVRGYPFEVRLPMGLKTGGVVLSDQIRSLDWKARNASFGENAPRDVVDEALSKIAAALGLVVP